MKTYKLVEYRPHTIAEGWAEAKKTLLRVMDDLHEEFIKQTQLIESSCGQRCYSIRLHAPESGLWMYLARDEWSIHGPAFFVKRESLKGHIDMPLRRFNEIIRWIGDITAADITSKIEEAL